MPIVVSTKLKMAVAVVVVLSGTVVALGCGALRAAGANGLLHPGRRVLDGTVREAHPQVTFAGADVTLSGWKFPAKGARRGTVVYLHEHSRRIFDSLRGQRRLLLVEGVGHNQSLQPASVWTEIENWIESVVGSNR